MACGITFRPTPTTAMRQLPAITDSIRMPPSLRPIGTVRQARLGWPAATTGPAAPGASSSSRSLGHLRPSRGGRPGTGGSSALASARPTASDRPDQLTLAGASASASENVSDAPAADCQCLPWRPRP